MAPPPPAPDAAAPVGAAPDVAAIARLVADDRLPPVERWEPAHCGSSAMRIARDGTWFHDGSPINRPEMVRLFSRILRREADGGHVLVTPVEKLDIAVDDAAFVAVELVADGEAGAARLAFRLNTGDWVIAGRDHAVRVDEGADGPRPYLHVRGGLEALITRPVFYALADRAEDGPGGVPGVWSDGVFFALAAA